MMRRGWFRESFRHGLSARGISTSKRKARTGKRRKNAVPFKWTLRRKFLAKKAKKEGVIEEAKRLSEGQWAKMTDEQRRMMLREVFERRNFKDLDADLDAAYADKYFAFKEERGLIGAETLVDGGKELKRANILAAQQRAVEELQQDEGKMWQGSVDKYINDDFKTHADDYLNNSIDHPTFKERVDASVKRFKDANRNDSIDAFGWAKKEGEQ